MEKSACLQHLAALRPPLAITCQVATPSPGVMRGCMPISWHCDMQLRSGMGASLVTSRQPRPVRSDQTASALRSEHCPLPRTAPHWYDGGTQAKSLSFNVTGAKDKDNVAAALDDGICPVMHSQGLAAHRVEVVHVVRWAAAVLSCVRAAILHFHGTMLAVPCVELRRVSAFISSTSCNGAPVGLQLFLTSGPVPICRKVRWECAALPQLDQNTIAGVHLDQKLTATHHKRSTSRPALRTMSSTVVKSNVELNWGHKRRNLAYA